MLRRALIFLSESELARRFSMHAPGARTVARRFVAGETIDDGIAACRQLVADGFLVTLDYLGESVKSRDEARAAADVYVRMINRIGGDPLLCEKVNVSLKLTQMGQDIRVAGSERGAGNAATATATGARPSASASTSTSAAAGGGGWPRPPAASATPEGQPGFDDAFLLDNVKRILDAAREQDLFVRFDMEGTPHTQRTLDFFRSLRDEGYHNVGVVLQSYLRRSEHDVREANRLDVRIRLCKGAYKEPAEYAYQDRDEVDANYIALMKLLLTDGRYPGIATHDESMLDATKDFARSQNVPVADWEFQMLYGIRRDLQHQLIAEGYNLRVYVAFGEAWYPYLMRRMAERPQNLMFIVSSIWTELFRRKRG